MADFTFGEYKNVRLQLNKSVNNQSIEIQNDTYLDIGLKGTRSDGLQNRKMSLGKL
jgi:hypothetical protein